MLPSIERSPENARAIRASMERWRVHNEHGRSLGRGLSEAELIDRVSGETGASKSFVRFALSRKA
ncbi:MAG: hypothetical protein HY924_15105 [Elusimicrobia bacterium]|nr:hypothetical protein [Elusimicrobiota bacterium]